VLWDVSTLCAVVLPPGLYGVVGTGVLWDVSTLCAVVPPPGLYRVVCMESAPAAAPVNSAASAAGAAALEGRSAEAAMLSSVRLNGSCSR
jgi:hypothetical protein